MFDHLGIFVSDSEKHIAFLEKCLAPLDITIVQRQTEIGAVIFRGPSHLPFLWVGPARGSYYGTEINATTRRPMHLAFVAPTKEAVDEFHRVGLEHGGRDNGAPDFDRRGAYHAFLLDPDGNNLEASFRADRS